MMKVAAFTLMELIVVMLLSTFVFIMALTAFQITGALYEQYEETSSQAVDFDRFRARLALDVELAEEVVLESGQLRCQQSELDVLYLLGEQAIVRSSSLPDTRPDTLLKGQYSLQGFWEEEKIGQGPIDALQLNSELLELPVELYFSKQKDAAYWLNK